MLHLILAIWALLPALCIGDTTIDDIFEVHGPSCAPYRDKLPLMLADTKKQANAGLQSVRDLWQKPEIDKQSSWYHERTALARSRNDPSMLPDVMAGEQHGYRVHNANLLFATTATIEVLSDTLRSPADLEKLRKMHVVLQGTVNFLYTPRVVGRPFLACSEDAYVDDRAYGGHAMRRLVA